MTAPTHPALHADMIRPETRTAAERIADHLAWADTRIDDFKQLEMPLEATP